jgi:hypothetical protein
LREWAFVERACGRDTLARGGISVHWRDNQHRNGTRERDAPTRPHRCELDSRQPAEDRRSRHTPAGFDVLSEDGELLQDAQAEEVRKVRGERG